MHVTDIVERGVSMKSSIFRGLAGVLLALVLAPSGASAQEHPDSRVLPQREQQVAARTPAGAHPLAAIAGSWSGGGLIVLTNDIQERLRCRANHTFTAGNNSLALSIRCASDNYKFELSSNVVERGGQISGHWREASYNVSGNISGRVSGNRVTLGIEAPADVRIVRGELRVDTDEKSPSARVAGAFHHATDAAAASVPHLAK